MADMTAFGEVEITATMAVKRKDGTDEYYKVVNDQSIAITKEEYDMLNQQKKVEG